MKSQKALKKIINILTGLLGISAFVLLIGGTYDGLSFGQALTCILLSLGIAATCTFIALEVNPGLRDNKE